MLSPDDIEDFVARLSAVDDERARRYPGDRLANQPVHTCYVPAHQFRPDVVDHWGSTALATLRAHPPDIEAPIRERVERKLAAQPIEDLRIDFEDGYGIRDEDAEDADAIRAASALPGTPYVGLRVKSFDTPALRRRSIRTLDLFLNTVGGNLPPGFLITFPKVTDVRQVEVFVKLLERLEDRPGALVFEIQVEAPQAIVDSRGLLALPGFIAAGQGRVRGLHFGTYDYTAGIGLPSASQHLAHDACDFARHVMQVSAAGTGVWCSDGSTNVLPVGDEDAIRHGWRTHARLVRRSLDHGFYQGWDLHPNQLVTRYATVYDFYRTGFPAARDRLSDYLAQRCGTVADEPATARMLAAFLLRALRCGAVDTDELPVGEDRLAGLL